MEILKFMTNVLRSIYRKTISNLKRRVIGNVLYRDLSIIKASSKHPVSQCLFFGDQVSTAISLPDYSYPNIPIEIEEKVGFHTPIRKHCKIFEDCLMMGRHSPIVLDSNGKPIWNAIAYQFFNFENNYAPLKWMLQKRRPIKEANSEYSYLMYTTWHSNYFHWLFDNLARLQFLDYFNDIYKKTKIYTPSNLLPFQRDSLSALGIESFELIGTSNIRVKNFLVPNFPLEQQGYDPEQIDWLRNRIWKNLGIFDIPSKSHRQNIIILRKPVSGRWFVNQDEILNALAAFDFKGYHLEELTFREQVHLFSNANVVIGAHGAGLANIIFSKQPIALIEIFGSQVFPCYFQLAKTLGFKYGYITNKSEPNGHGKQSNIHLDVQHLCEIIRSFID